MWGFIKDGVTISKRSEQILLKFCGIEDIEALRKLEKKKQVNYLKRKKH